MANIIPSKAPSLINAPDSYGKSYTDNLNNILRLYFNTIDGNNAYILNTLISLQDQIDAQQIQINRDLTLVWVGSGEGIFSG